MIQMTREEAAQTIYGVIIGADECEEDFCLFSDQIEALEMGIEALKQLEQKKAKWVFGTTMNRGWMKCTNCCVSQTPCGTFSYCPNCGAKMMVDLTDDSVEDSSHPFADDVMMEDGKDEYEKAIDTLKVNYNNFSEELKGIVDKAIEATEHLI